MSIPELPAELAELLDDASPASDAASDPEVAAFLGEHTRSTRPEILAGLTSKLGDRFDDGGIPPPVHRDRPGRGDERSPGRLLPGAVSGRHHQANVRGGGRPAPASGRQGAARNGSVATSEFRGILAWAIGQANAADLDEVRARVTQKMPDNVHEVKASTMTNTAASDDTVDAVTHSAHLGMAVKLARLYGGKLLYVHGVGWHRWDGKRWARDGDGAARRAVHAMLKRDRRIVISLGLSDEEREKRLRQIARYETASAITGILTEAAVLQAFSVTVNDLDADPWLFNCQNGTLDLRTMELWAHDPADRISKVANAAYRPDTGGTQWAAFLERVLPEQAVRDYMQRLSGLSLLGEVNGDKQIAPIMTGSGANGKTTFIEAMSFPLGDYAATAEPTLLMAKRGDAHPTGVADLLGRRFVSVVETEQGRRFDIALLKWLTGGDTLKARYMRQDFFSFKPRHLLLMATNHLPAHRRRHRGGVAAHPRHPVHRANPEGRARQAR